jgi:hypothetical protein
MATRKAYVTIRVAESLSDRMAASPGGFYESSLRVKGVAVSPFFYPSVGASLAHVGSSKKGKDCPIWGRALKPKPPSSASFHRTTFDLS